MRLTRASHHDTYGPADPSNWRYRLTLTGPTHTRSIMVPAAGVLHFKWAHHGYETGYGKSPLEAVRTTLTILSNTAARLAEESGAPSGYLLPLPDRGDQAGGKSDDAEFAKTLVQLKGKLGVAPGTSAGLGWRSDDRRATGLRAETDRDESAGRATRTLRIRRVGDCQRVRRTSVLAINGR